MRKLGRLGILAVLAVTALPREALAQDDLQPPGSPPRAAPCQPGQPQQPGQPPCQPQNATEADLQKSEKEDSGLGLEWVYLNADAGVSYIDLKSFSESQLALTDTNKTGAMFGVGAGVRLLFLTLGVRVRNHTAFNLWQINGDIGLHMRFWRFDPYLAIRGGYDTVGSFNQSVSVTSQLGNTQNTGVDIHGFNAGAAFGMDFYFSHLISLGAEVAGDVLFLQRPQVPVPQQLQNQLNMLPPAQQQQIKASSQYQLYGQSGSSVGFGGGLSAHFGIHF